VRHIGVDTLFGELRVTQMYIGAGALFLELMEQKLFWIRWWFECPFLDTWPFPSLRQGMYLGAS
jgi:hypothetical protein